MTIGTVAVTGGSGTIGSEIVDFLDGEGYRTVNLDQRRDDDGAADQFIEVDLLQQSL